MQTYRTQVTVTDSKRIVLIDVPFAPGDVVEIVVRPLRDLSLSERFRKLMRETQRLPEAQPITAEEIAAEIEAYRRGL